MIRQQRPPVKLTNCTPGSSSSHIAFGMFYNRRVMSDSDKATERGARGASAVGRRLRQLRVERGLTQTEVTGGGYSKEYVSQVELGKTVASRRAIKFFAQFLDVDESYFETGVDPAGRERFESLLTAGEVLTARGEAEEATAVFAGAQAIAARAENPSFVWRAEVGRAWALHALGRHREALDLLAGARSYYAEAAPRGREVAEVLYRLGCVRETVGDLQSALGSFEEALRVLDPDERSADSLRLRTLARITGIHARRQDLAAAVEAARAARELAAVAEDRRAVADAFWQAARVEGQRGEYARANEYGLRARDLLSELGERRDTARVLRDLGVVKMQMGASADALACFDQGLEALRTADDPATRASLLNEAAAAKLALGDLAGALRTAGDCLDVLGGDRAHGVPAGEAHLTRCAALLAGGEVDRARHELLAAVEACGAEADRVVRGRLLVAEGDLLLVEGRVVEAAGAFRRATMELQGAGQRDRGGDRVAVG